MVYPSIIGIGIIFTIFMFFILLSYFCSFAPTCSAGVFGELFPKCHLRSFYRQPEEEQQISRRNSSVAYFSDSYRPVQTPPLPIIVPDNDL